MTDMLGAVGGGTSKGSQIAGAGSIGGQLGGLAFDLFGNYKDPSESAQKWFDNIPDVMKDSFKKWMDSGYGQFQNAGNQYGQLMNDPNSVMNKWGSQYQSSPGYKWQVDQALGGANRAAAAGGMAGSPQAQQYGAQIGNNLANQDYYKYMNYMNGLYDRGLQGADTQSQLGYDASQNYAEGMGQYYTNSGKNAYVGAQNQNQKNAGDWSSIGSLAGMAAAAAFL